MTVDVVVVGAGMGGLSAATALVEAGRDVLVVEARDRVGGRLLSVERDEAGLDLGATWFWDGEPRVGRLVAALELNVHKQYIGGAALYQDARGVHRLEGNPVGGPAGRVTAGMQTLATALAHRLPPGTVRTGRAVSRIRRTPHGLEVSVDGAPIHASAVVLAVPPALALARIAFDPRLPSDLESLASRTPVWMGSMTKVVVRYREPFWRTAGLAGAVVSHVGPLREVHDMSGPGGRPAALFGFVPPGRPGPSVGEDEVVAQLVRLFGSPAAGPDEVLVHDWRREIHTAPDRAEALTDYSTYGHPIYRRPSLDGRLHWASTETSAVVPGHVEGALAAGARAASAILAGTPA